jgi:hypothetical protein
MFYKKMFAGMLLKTAAMFLLFEKLESENFSETDIHGNNKVCRRKIILKVSKKLNLLSDEEKRFKLEKSFKQTLKNMNG